MSTGRDAIGLRRTLPDRDDRPVAADEALALFERAFFEPRSRPLSGAVLLAVSGGPDSMAMLQLAFETRSELRNLGIEFHVATVDHGLRESARLEAETVAQVCRGLDFPHRILRWQGAKPRSNVQGAARRARYDLLAEAAATFGATAILTAHHQDDQIETHCLAMERGSGDRGLAGMRSRRALAPGLELLRPFLDVAGGRLRATAQASRLPVFDDPSNRDERNGRVRTRSILASLGEAERGERLAEIARHRENTDSIDRLIAAALEQGEAVVDGLGRVHINGSGLCGLPDGVRAELLARIVVAVTGAEHAPVRRSLERLSESLAGRRASTLGGVRIEPGERVVFCREYGRDGPSPVSFSRHDEVLFDGRFVVSLELNRETTSAAIEGARLVPLGALGRGNPAERTMPVLLGRDARPLAVPAEIARKMPETSGRLKLMSHVEWRLWADLPRDEMA